MASPESLWGGIRTAIYGIVLSIILVFSLGIVSEKLMSSFETTTIGTGTIFDLPAPWDMGYTDAAFWMTILYILCIMPALIGLVVMFVSAVKTQEYDVFSDPNNQEFNGNSLAFPQYVSPEEMAFRSKLG